MELISIIIPVYNRFTLLSYTLDSILKQSYTNWECILVDDCSDDDSYFLMQEYQNKDARIKAFKRPSSLRKGANSCRNYGFLQTSGSYIKWFDSDDIMLPNHLEIAYETIVKYKLDFVVTGTLNFNHETGEILDKPYIFDRRKAIITAENFALNRLGWITDDFLGTRAIVEKIKFNENITTDGDEYNFFVRFLNESINGVFIDEVVTHRRVHNDSLTGKNGYDTSNFLIKIANLKYQTAQDLVVWKNDTLICWFLSGYMHSAFEIAMRKGKIPFLIPAFKLICNYYSFIKGIVFLVALGCAKYLKKGYFIMKYVRN